MKTHYHIIIPIMLLTACVIRPREKTVFTFPVVVNSSISDTVTSKKYEARSISAFFPHFVGKYSFQDSIDINPYKRDTSIYRDFVGEYRDITMDDNLDVHGLELRVDYETTVKYRRFKLDVYEYYPVYFINSTNSDKVFFGKDGYVFGIQEAVYTYGFTSWAPIETRGHDFCGVGRWGLVVHPKEFVVILMRKYKGDFKTQLRVRFELGESIYVSAPFKGKINGNQFYIHTDTYLDRILQKGDEKTINSLFYGAKPPKKKWIIKAPKHHEHHNQ